MSSAVRSSRSLNEVSGFSRCHTVLTEKIVQLRLVVPFAGSQAFNYRTQGRKNSPPGYSRRLDADTATDHGGT